MLFLLKKKKKIWKKTSEVIHNKLQLEPEKKIA